MPICSKNNRRRELAETAGDLDEKAMDPAEITPVRFTHGYVKGLCAEVVANFAEIEFCFRLPSHMVAVPSLLCQGFG